MHASETTTCPCSRLSDARVGACTRSRMRPGVKTEWYVPTPTVPCGQRERREHEEARVVRRVDVHDVELPRAQEAPQLPRPDRGSTVCSVCEPLP